MYAIADYVYDGGYDYLAHKVTWQETVMGTVQMPTQYQCRLV